MNIQFGSRKVGGGARRLRRNLNAPGMSADYVPPDYPGGADFWATHRVGLILCLLGGLGCVLVLVFSGAFLSSFSRGEI